MHKQKAVLLFFFFWICVTNKSFSQITQNSGPVSACAPANITFTAPANASSISWTFGSFGSFNSSTGSFNVINAASFNAVFSGIVGGSPVTFTVPVVVHAKPVANFNLSSPASGCAPKTLTLTDQSTTTSTIQTWQWVYGDGNLFTTTSGGTHTYTYTSVGTFTINLIVTDVNGCNNQVSQGPINITAPPVAVISSNPPLLTGCSSNFSAIFSGTNSSGTGLTYSWNFGNSQTSQLATTGSITFTSQPNLYPVTLTVTANGCSAVANTFVTVSPATLSVSVPPTVCVNAPATVTIQSNQPYTTWTLGNFTVVNVATPAASPYTTVVSGFAFPGIVSVTVNAGVSPCLTTPVIQNMFVDMVVANFSSTPVTGCSPLTATFTNQSSINATQFVWSYGNYQQNSVTTSTLANPTLTFTQGSLNPYTIFKTPYIPSVTLTAISAAGCMSSISHTAQVIRRPTAWFNKNKKEGCVPLSVTLRDSSYAYSADPIASYTWCNGATPSVVVTGTVAAPPSSGSVIPFQVFNYTTTGTFYPYLIIQTANGCVDVSFIDTVIVASPPNVSFAFAPNVVCPNQPVQITNTTPNYTLVQHWHVESDNGFFSGCVNDPNPSWYFTNVGTHTISLTGYQNGCKSTVLSTQNIIVKGPIVETRYETNCTSRMAVNFYSQLQEVQTATLNFGDNSAITINGNPSGVLNHTVIAHTYSASGNYTATITGINSITGCAASVYSTVVTVRNVQSNFTYPNTGCTGANVFFNGVGSTDVQTGCARGYVWFVDTQPPIDAVQSFLSYSFTSSGVHTVSLLVKDLNGCSATSSHTLRISSVTAAFSINSPTVCLSTGTIQLTNTTSQLPDPIVNYSWNFGNGQTLSTSVAAVPVVTYTNAQVPSSTYIISLIAVNSIGCSQTVTHQVQVIKPQVAFSASPQNICLVGTTPGNITFNSLNSNSSYTLDYGVSPSSTLITTSGVSSYAYANPGTYTVLVTLQNFAGCRNSGDIVVNAVRTPTAGFDFNSPGSTGGLNICSGNLVTFTNASLPQPPTPAWNLGSGILSNTNNVVTAFYSAATTSVVAVSLTVNTGAPAFCVSSVTKNFTINVASADISLSRSVVCLGETVQMNIINSTGVSAWVWDFGDATPSATVFANAIPPPQNFTVHAYNNYTATSAGITSVSLIYWSVGEYCKAASPLVQIKVIKVDPDFNRNNELLRIDSVHCINIADRFNNTSTSNSSGLSYHWDFSNGFKSDSISPTYLFPLAGSFEVTLTAKDVNNCSVSTIKHMTIFPLPTATITGGSNCPDKPFVISADGAQGVISGTWSPASGIVGSPEFTTSVTNFTATAMASSSSDYSLTVSDLNGCVSLPTFTNIYIQQPAPASNWDTTVVVGELIPINATANGLYTYTWNPAVDLNCFYCPTPVSSSTVDITYSVSIEDTLRCSIVTSKYKINVLPRSSVDVPTAFTPDGDGNNDVIYVAGWGIKKLNYFRVYNRYGELVFESNDIKMGWNGIYKGVEQNIETYVYQVSVETYIDKDPLLKTGTFILIR